MKLTELSLGICIALSLAACSNNKSEESILRPDQYDSTADSMGITVETTTDLPGNGAKLVKTADIDFQVKDVYKSSINITQNIKNLGGLVMHNDIKTSQLDTKTISESNDSLQIISSYTINAEMMVKIPSENLDDFVKLIAADATIIYTAKLDIDDRSIDYLSSKLKQQSRQKILNRELKKDTLKTNDLLQLANQQETIIDQKMNNLRTDANVRYSTISLHFTQNTLLKRENLPNHNLNIYQPSVYKRFGNALSGGFNFFIDLAIVLSYIWPFIILGLGGWGIARYVTRKMKVKLKS